MKAFGKSSVCILAVVILVTSLSACSKKDKIKTLADSVESYISDTDAKEYRVQDFDDINDFVGDITQLDADELNTGIVARIDNKDLCDITEDIQIPAVINAYLDPDDISNVTFYLSGFISEKSVDSWELISLLNVEFVDSKSATNVFELIEFGGAFLNNVGFDFDSLSKDEYDYSSKSKEGHLILNIPVTDLYEVIADSTQVNVEDFENAFEEHDIDITDMGNVILTIAVKENSILISIVYGEESITSLNNIMCKADMIEPATVKTSEYVLEYIGQLVENYWNSQSTYAKG